jgi:hypothetical protein
MRRDCAGTQGGGPARLSQTRTPPASATCACFFSLLMCCPDSYAADPARVNRAHIGDPLKVNEGIPVSPSADMLPGEGRCRSSEFLPDPLTLFDATVISLCRNPDTRAAWEAIRTQAAVVGQSRAAYLPKIQFSASNSRLDRVTSFPGFPELISELESGSGERSAAPGWILYDFGLRAAGRESAKQQLISAHSAANSVLQEVLFNTARYFNAAQAARALQKAAAETESLANESLRVANVLFQAEVVALSDKLQAETALFQAAARRGRRRPAQASEGTERCRGRARRSHSGPGRVVDASPAARGCDRHLGLDDIDKAGRRSHSTN